MSTFPSHVFDSAKLPAKAAVDTVFLIRAFEKPHQDNGVSEQLLRRLMAGHATIYVPAVVLSEFEITGATKLPRTPRMQVAAYDEAAANNLLSVGNAALRAIQVAGGNRYVIRNDAMIAATAARHGAVLLSGDKRKDMSSICNLLGIQLVDPVSLITTTPSAPQLTLIPQVAAPVSSSST